MPEVLTVEYTLEASKATELYRSLKGADIAIRLEVGAVNGKRFGLDAVILKEDETAWVIERTQGIQQSLTARIKIRS